MCIHMCIYIYIYIYSNNIPLYLPLALIAVWRALSSLDSRYGLYSPFAGVTCSAMCTAHTAQ